MDCKVPEMGLYRPRSMLRLQFRSNKGKEVMKMEKLVCDRCGREYTSEADITLAKKGRDEWEAMVRKDGNEPRGICPCPVIPCEGEMKLVVV